QNWEKAEENFEIIYKKFPNGVFNSKALFMLGYINANHLNNLEKAKKYYTEFLEKYPNHELADDAKYELDNLGKNVEEYPFMKRDEQDDEVNTAGTNSETITIQK
ncbi:MAG: outer membrane protein assembly factor BamD, partial [Methanobacteriota archaeon]